MAEPVQIASVHKIEVVLVNCWNSPGSLQGEVAEQPAGMAEHTTAIEMDEEAEEEPERRSDTADADDAETTGAEGKKCGISIYGYCATSLWGVAL